ncbi:MAG: M20 family metallopeptidase [Methanomicrobiales archaeon]|nr:M20 family metallopeptidase [Methanomicrobiales archaeon]
MDVVRLCSEMVKIRTENPPGYTDEVVLFLQEVCTSIGIETKILKQDRKWNLLSKKRCDQLLLCGHVDVVPAMDESWDLSPFSGDISEEHVHGRGSTDMKGGCAALLAALAEVIDDGYEPLVDLAFVCDEEGNGDFGMEYLVKKGYLRPKTCLIAEPTPPLSPVIGEKGIVRLNLTFTGNAGHSSLYPVMGNSAIEQALTSLDYFKELHEKSYPEDPLVHEVISNATVSLSKLLSLSPDQANKILSRLAYNPGIIAGGERINMIAQKCTMEMDMRIPWGCNIDQLLELLNSHLPSCDVQVIDRAEPTLSRPGILYDLVCAGIEAVFNKKAMPGVTQAASDARHLRETGAEVVNYGPGDLSLLHAVNERVPIHMLYDCRNVYKHILKNLPS